MEIPNKPRNVIISAHREGHSIVQRELRRAERADREAILVRIPKNVDPETFTYNLPVKTGDEISIVATKPFSELFCIYIYLQQRFEDTVSILLRNDKKAPSKVPYCIRKIKEGPESGVLPYDTCKCGGSCSSCDH